MVSVLAAIAKKCCFFKRVLAFGDSFTKKPAAKAPALPGGSYMTSGGCTGCSIGTDGTTLTCTACPGATGSVTLASATTCSDPEGVGIVYCTTTDSLVCGAANCPLADLGSNSWNMYQ